MTAELNAYHKGPVSNFTGTRDPLAVAFDRAADALVHRAIAARGLWTATLVHTPEGARDLDPAGLTHHERAFLQACYYHRLIYMWGSGTDGEGNRVRNPDRRYSLKRRWGGMSSRGRYSGRILEVRALRVGEASLYAKERGWTG